MSEQSSSLAIEIRKLIRSYGRTEAVNGLDLEVRPGRCHALFGRNGAGKSTTIKCMLNLLRPTSGTLRIFGHDPQKDEVAVKARVGYVPEVVAFYPWMTGRDVLEYAASFRTHWNRTLEADLLARFDLDPAKKVSALSKGMRSQLGLICAICPEPEMLILDEPTSGLDPIVRRELIEAVIGSYLEADPGRRTVFVSTHLITEFEGLVDEFTVIESGRNLITLEADAARARMKRLHVRFAEDAPTAPLIVDGLRERSRQGRTVTFVTTDFADDLPLRAQALGGEEVRIEDLSLEEIFIEASHAARSGGSSSAEVSA